MNTLGMILTSLFLLGVAGGILATTRRCPACGGYGITTKRYCPGGPRRILICKGMHKDPRVHVRHHCCSYTDPGRPVRSTSDDKEVSPS